MRGVCLAASFLTLASAGAAPLARADDQRPVRVVDCAGEAAEVAGDGERVEIRGACRTLSVDGDDNDVAAEVAAGAQVRVAGARNRVLLRQVAAGAAPSIESPGDGNDVSLAATDDAPALLPTAPAAAALAAPVAAPPEPGALVLDGDGLNQVVRCGGRDVLIHGSDGRFRLTGGCRSVSVQGDGARIEAELQPGARVAIGGISVRLNYILTGPGPLPVLSISGRQSEARHVDHLSSILGPSAR